MKKTISAISLVLVFVILTACLVGCAPTNERHYHLESTDVIACLVCCAPENENTAKAKLEKKGYTVEIMSAEEMDAMLQQYAPINFSVKDFGVKGYMKATKGQDTIMAYWFENKEEAEYFEDSNYDLMGTIGQMDGIDLICGVKGKVFYAGTEQGIKDFFQADNN